MPKTRHKDPGQSLDPTSENSGLTAHSPRAGRTDTDLKDLLTRQPCLHGEFPDWWEGPCLRKSSRLPRNATKAGLWPLHALSHTNSSFSRHGTNCACSSRTQAEVGGLLESHRLYGKASSQRTTNKPHKSLKWGYGEFGLGSRCAFPISPIKYN